MSWIILLIVILYAVGLLFVFVMCRAPKLVTPWLRRCGSGAMAGAVRDDGPSG